MATATASHANARLARFTAGKPPLRGRAASLGPSSRAFGGVIARRCGAGTVRRDGGRWRRGGSAPQKRGSSKTGQPQAAAAENRFLAWWPAEGVEGNHETIPGGLPLGLGGATFFPIKGDEARKPWPNGQRNVLSAAAARQGNEINKAMTPNRVSDLWKCCILNR